MGGHKPSLSSHPFSLSTYLSSLRRTSWESEGPQTILATGICCRPGSSGCGFWNIVPNHTSYPVRGAWLGKKFSSFSAVVSYPKTCLLAWLGKVAGKRTVAALYVQT